MKDTASKVTLLEVADTHKVFINPEPMDDFKLILIRIRHKHRHGFTISYHGHHWHENRRPTLRQVVRACASL